MQDCGPDGGIQIRSTIAEQVDERNLHMALARNAAGGDEHHSFIQSGLIDPGIDDDPCHLDDVCCKRAASNWILGDELEQRGIAEVVSSFKQNMLAAETRMLLQVLL